MTTPEQETNDFAARVRVLLLRYKEAQDDIARLRADLAAAERKAADAALLAEATKRDYDTLKAARLLEVSNTDLDETRRRVARLVRSVDKCITLLTEQQDASQP